MPSFNRTGLARLRSILQSHIDNQRIPGAVAVVALGGQVELFESMGLQDPQAGAPMKDDAIFRIYSMTKPIVSLATLMLAEEGVLQMGDPLSKYLPEFAGQQVAVEEGERVRLEPARQEATVQDLLRHTAGFTYEFLGSNAVQRQYEAADIASPARTNAEFCKVLARLPLAHQPGTPLGIQPRDRRARRIAGSGDGPPARRAAAGTHPRPAGHEGHRVHGGAGPVGPHRRAFCHGPGHRQ